MGPDPFDRWWLRSYLSEDARSLISELLCKDQSKRISVRQVADPPTPSLWRLMGPARVAGGFCRCCGLRWSLKGRQ